MLTFITARKKEKAWKLGHNVSLGDFLTAEIRVDGQELRFLKWIFPWLHEPHGQEIFVKYRDAEMKAILWFLTNTNKYILRILSWWFKRYDN